MLFFMGKYVKFNKILRSIIFWKSNILIIINGIILKKNNLNDFLLYNKYVIMHK